MFNKKLFAAISAITLASMACGFNFNIPPITDVVTGPTVVEDILVEMPTNKDEVTDVSLSFGAGVLTINPGAEHGLISGTATFNVDDLKPVINSSNSLIELDTGSINLKGFPNFTNKVINEWDLKLGSSLLDLTIKAGAYVGDYDLGGLSITNLHISDGAADTNVNFSSPNLIDMGTFRYETGASNVTLKNLANAGFSTMMFQSGVGNYVLDFSGELRADTNVFIESGLSSLTIIIPEGVSAEVTIEGGFLNVNRTGEWTKVGSSYDNFGDGPSYSITVEMAAGNLSLRNR